MQILPPTRILANIPVHIVLSTCVLVSAQAYSATPLRAELAGDFHETVQEDVAVSGSVVVGVAATSALSGEATLAGLVIPASEDSICLTVLSRDGVYFSRNTYRMPDGAMAGGGTLVVLPFDGTKERDLISHYPLGDLAVRASPVGCEQSSGTYLVATNGSEFDTIDVLVNAFGANAVYYRTADGAEADCDEFTEGRRTSYDYRCTIPVDVLGTGHRQLTIERERYGRPLGKVQIELQLGSAQ